MGHLLSVRDRSATTDEMFEPLKQTIDMLKSYEHEMSEEVHQQLQVSNHFLSLSLISTQSLRTYSINVMCFFPAFNLSRIKTIWLDELKAHA